MDIERTANLLGTLATALSGRIAGAAARAGLSESAAAAVAVVGFYPGRETIEALSRVLRLSHSGTVRLVDRLVADGLMERRRGEDGRSVALVLTAEGSAAKARLLAARREAIGAALGGLGPLEAEALTVLTERLLAALTTDADEADHICRLCDEAVCPAETCPVECALNARQEGPAT